MEIEEAVKLLRAIADLMEGDDSVPVEDAIATLEEQIKMAAQMRSEMQLGKRPKQ